MKDSPYRSPDVLPSFMPFPLAHTSTGVDAPKASLTNPMLKRTRLQEPSVQQARTTNRKNSPYEGLKTAAHPDSLAPALHHISALIRNGS
jgi:hypothetical protein